MKDELCPYQLKRTILAACPLSTHYEWEIVDTRDGRILSSVITSSPFSPRGLAKYQAHLNSTVAASKLFFPSNEIEAQSALSVPIMVEENK